MLHHHDTPEGPGGIPSDLKFCPRCAGHLKIVGVEGTRRPVCEVCHYVFYLDPKLAVSVLIPMGQGILLGKRAIDPRRGFWSFPGGYVDRGEVVELAAIREVYEETGLSVELGPLLSLYSSANSPVVLAVYMAAGVRGTPRAGEEVLELAVYPPDSLPEMAFPHDLRIVQDWQARKSQQGSLGCGLLES